MWKNIASFFLGTVVGGSLVYLITKTDFEKREQEAVDSIKKEYKDYYNKKEKESVREAEIALVKKLNAEKEAMAEQIIGAKSKEKEDEEEESEDISEESDSDYIDYGKMFPDSDHIDYGKMFVDETLKKDIRSDREELNTTTPFYNDWAEELNNTEDEYEEDEDDEASDYMPDDYHPSDDHNQSPFGISRREFANGKLYFDKSDLEYYEYDGVLVDPYTEEEITDLKNSVGENFTIEFDKEDPDMAYIRNENTGSDYSIRRIHARYYEETDED